MYLLRILPLRHLNVKIIKGLPALHPFGARKNQCQHTFESDTGSTTYAFAVRVAY
jgi:hypothetical protein